MLFDDPMLAPAVDPDEEERRRRLLMNGPGADPGDGGEVYSQMQQLPPSLGTAMSAFSGDWGGKPVVNQDIYQPPLNSMMPGYTQPNMRGVPTLPNSSDYGPAFNPTLQARHALFQPQLDRSVDGSMTSEADRGGAWGGTQASPYGVLDNFMSRDPVHTLGVNGFRTGSSSPAVDASGMMQRNDVNRMNMQLMTLAQRQDEMAHEHAIKREMFSSTMGNKRAQSLDRAIMLAGNAKVPVEMASAEIQNMLKSGEITQEQADAMLLERHTSVPDQHGQLVPLGVDKKTGSLLNLLGKVPNDVNPDVARKFMTENRGITRDQVVKRYEELLRSGLPWVDPAKGNLDGKQNPDLFKRENLTPEQRTEFDAITKIFGSR